MSQATEKMRPYWHVDLKWIFGILTAFFLSISLLLFVLTNLTNAKTAIPLATLIVAGQFSRNGIDDATEIQEAKNEYLNSGEEVYNPLPGATITRSDFETLSPRELRLKIFRQVVEPFYYRKATEETVNQAGLLAFLNEETHLIIQQVFFVSLVPVALSLAGLIFFSYRYGKLVSPAVVFLLLGFFPSVILFLLSTTRPPLDSKGYSEGLKFLPYETIQNVASAIAPPYFFLFWSAVLLLIAVPIIKLLKRSRPKK